MRVAVLVGVSVLLAGCSQATTSAPEPSATSASVSASGSAPPTTSTTQSSPAPAAGAPIADVMAWVQAGRPADGAGYHSATRDGTTNDLGDDLAFTGGHTRCMSRDAKILSCLVDLAVRPSPPPDTYGNWVGNWVDFDGGSLQVGSAHGDPGPFLLGDGRALPDGQTLAFGDFRCRAEPAGLSCVNYAHRSGVRLAATGIEPFGCLHPQVPTPPDAGQRFTC